MQTLFYGGDIVTMDRGAAAQALLTEDGRILEIGDLRTVSKKADGTCRRVELGGAALLPAFIDAHSHFTQVAYSFLQVSLNGVRSLREMQARISNFAQERAIAPGAWVTAWDFDPADMESGKTLSLADLDTLAPQHKLVIRHKSGHMGWFNSAALEAFGVTTQTKAPDGGRIESRDGMLTGYMEENAFFRYLKQMPPPDDAALLQSYRKAQTLYASHGIATVQEGMCTLEMLPAYKRLLSSDLLQLDLVVYTDLQSFDAFRALLADSRNPHCRVGGVKIFLDGSPQGRTAWMRAPYLGGGDPDYRGYGVMTDEQVYEAFCFAAERHTQLLAHCNGDAACEQFLQCLARAEERFPTLKALRPVMIHAQFLGEDQIRKAAALGAVASFFIAHAYHWGDVHLQNLGKTRAENLSPAASALRAGLPFTFHQDAPVIAPDMLETLWCAVCRQTKSGVVLNSHQAVSAEAALAAVTRTAAWQYGEEAQKGTLALGLRADLVILDRNPLCVPPQTLRTLQVLATYKDGEAVFAQGSAACVPAFRR